MRILTWNINGIRSAAKKGLWDRIDAIAPDVACFQEIRAHPEVLTEDLRSRAGWHVEWHPAKKPGYAGTGAWCRTEFAIEARGMGGGRAADDEGRILVSRCSGIRIVNTYLPSGSAGPHRQAIKDRWLPRFARWIAPMARSRVPTILCGDLNIAHTPRDIYYAKSNEKNSGFLPHEREWIGDLIASGWRDLVREDAGDRDGPYTWWSNRGQARALDRGWRIDYILANRAAHRLVTGVAVHREASLGISDHAPITVDLDTRPVH